MQKSDIWQWGASLRQANDEVNTFINDADLFVKDARYLERHLQTLLLWILLTIYSSTNEMKFILLRSMNRHTTTC